MTGGAGRLAMRAAALWLLLAAAGGESLQAQAAADYGEAVREALDEFGRHHYVEAYALFSQAHQQQPSARTLRGMAACSFELRQYVRALREIRAALEETRKPLDAAQRKEAQELIRRSERFVGQIRLQLEPEDAEASIDGIPVDVHELQLLDAGTHALRVRHDGFETEDRRLEVVGGKDQTLQIRLHSFARAGVASTPAQPAPEAPAEPAGGGARVGRVWTWVALGATGVLGATTIAFGVKARSAYDSVDEECPARACTGDQTEQAIDDSHVTTFQTLTNAGIGLTAAAAATTLVLLFVERPRESPPALSIGPGGVRWHTKF